ncbi:MAG: hypothetical protein L3J39_05095 [Verrucomicrobiales bacterium]|nr:hypothetical protein [Verrucomicrobiales bacterium]
MPKGGDLHHHYSGTLYAETYLDWVKEKKWLIDPTTLHIIKKDADQKDSLLSVDQVRADNTLYRKLLSLWSDKDFWNHNHPQSPPDKQFFSTFSYFSPVMDEYTERGLQLIKQRALAENVSYIETMLTEMGVYQLFLEQKKYLSYNQSLRQAQSQDEIHTILSQVKKQLLATPAFTLRIDHYISNLEKYHQSIDSEDFTMRYQSYALRVIDPMPVFKDLLAAFIAANQSELVVGVNILGPENNLTALKDYSLHMQMFNYLSGEYPKVKKSIHAGELTIGMVRPKSLKFHIREARKIAGADRIGHGIDLMYEKDSPELLQDLKENAAIEINLSSNQFILGVKGLRHPYLIYSDYGVPIVISSDDSGVSRNNLSHEYVLLATRYQPSYSQIKKYVYNSITYSFLDEKNKARLTTQLDTRFRAFEQKMAKLQTLKLAP